MPEAARPGQAVLVRAVARDKRLLVDWGLDLGPQESATPWHEVKIVAPEAASKAAMAQLDGLRDAIWKLLEKQLQARSAAAVLGRDAESAGAAYAATRLAGRRAINCRMPISCGRRDSRQPNRDPTNRGRPGRLDRFRGRRRAAGGPQGAGALALERCSRRLPAATRC